MASSETKELAKSRKWALGSRTRTLKAFGLLLSALLAGAVLFGLGVYREISATQERQLRLLDRAAHDAEVRIGLTLSNVHNLQREIHQVQGRAKKSSSANQQDSSQATAASQFFKKRKWNEEKKEEQKAKDQKIEEFVKRQPYLSRRSGVGAKHDESEPCADSVGLDIAATPPVIHFGDCDREGRLRFDFDVSGLMESVLPASEFEGFLLFGDKGERLVQLDTASSGLMIRTSSNLGDLSGGADPLGLGELPVRRTVSHSLSVADHRIVLSCQPVVVPLQLTEDGRVGRRATWTLCGAVARGEMVRKAITLSPGWTMGFGILALLGIGLVPFAKPLFMARRERLTRTDLVFVAIGTLLILHLLSIVGFSVYRVLAFRGVNIAQLQALANRVEASLNHDFEAFYKTLKTLDSARCAALGAGEAPVNPNLFADDEPPSHSVEQDYPPRETWLLDPSKHEAICWPETNKSLLTCDLHDWKQRLRFGCLLSREAEVPLLHSAFWVDHMGSQVHKVTARDKNTSVVNVASREYFQAVRDGYAERPSFFVDTAFSLTTGTPFFALARPSACPDDEDTLQVAVLTATLQAMEPSISEPFGFAVFRPDGEVIVSSRDDLHPDDDFYSVVEESRELGAALASKAPQRLNLELSGRPHRVWLQPFEPNLSGSSEEADWLGRGHWWVATFYDREMTGTLFAELLTLSIGLSLLFCFAVGLVAFAMRKRLRAMIWPRSDLLPTYLRILGLLAAYLLVWVGCLLAWILSGSRLVEVWSNLAALEFLGPLVLVLLLAALPLAIVHLGFLLRSRGRSEEEAAQSWLVRNLVERGVKRPDRWVYRAMLVCFWAAMGVVPAAFFFESAWTFETQSLTQYEARWWDQEMEDRKQRIRTEWEDLAREDLINHRICSEHDRFPIFPFVPQSSTSSDSQEDSENPEGPEDCSPSATDESPKVLKTTSGHPFEILAQFLPTYNETTSRIRHQWAGPVPDFKEELGLRNLPDSSEGGYAKWILIVVLLALLAVIWAWIRFVSQHFALRHFRRPDPGAPLEELVEETSHAQGSGPLGRRIVILTSNQHWSEARRLPAGDLIDLSSLPGSPDPEEPPEDEGSAKSGQRLPVAVFGLAQALADPALRASARQRLAVLVDSSRPIMIFTGTDPWSILAEEGLSEDQGEGSPEDDNRRWASILSEFRTEYARIQWDTMGSGPNQRSAGDHWAIWWRCSDAEKLTLLQLAQEGFLNPKQSTELDHLVRRNILTFENPRRPISFVDDEFCSFVQGAVASERLLAWEKTAGDSEGWQGLRYVFGLFFLAVFGFLFLVDQSLFDNLQSVLAALAALIPLSLGLLNRFQRPSE